MQLRKFDVSPSKIQHIFISHLHGDHYLGLAGLLFSMHLLRREQDLHLYTFRGLEEILLAQLKHAQSSLNFKVILHPLTEERPEVLFEDSHVRVTSFPLDHKIPTCGFLFQEMPRPRSLDKTKSLGTIPVEYLPRLKAGEDIRNEKQEIIFKNKEYTLPPPPCRSYAYCSDTQPSEEVANIVKGVDLVYHEATFADADKAKARDTMHSTASEAAAIAKAASVKKLIIGHFSARYKDLSILLHEATSVFPNTELAVDGESFEITDE